MIEYEYDAFFSYSSKNNDWVRKLAVDLAERGVKIWSYEDRIETEDFISVINKTLPACRNLVLALTKESLQSPWVEKEVNYSISREIKERRDIIVVVKLENVEPWPLIATKRMIDFTETGNYPENLNSLASRLTENFKSPIRIISPSHAAEISSPLVVEGECSPEFTSDIWVFVWPELSPMYGWPQSDDAFAGNSAMRINGRWAVTCYFEGLPQKYDIAVNIATPEASRIIGDSLMRWAREKRYPGFHRLTLPEGLTEIQRISVRRNR
jgi:hypothetical protein